MKRALVLALLSTLGCGPKVPPVRLTEDCAATPWSDYEGVTKAYTREDKRQDSYQEWVHALAIFKSPEWRASYASRDAENRGLSGEQRNQALAQACAAMAGPYEFEIMLTTWDRRENDLDRGDRSVWQVRLLDQQGNEVAPLQIIKDKRPSFTLRADYPPQGDFGGAYDFATAYIVRFPRPEQGKPPLLGPGVQKLTLRMSSHRGFIEFSWTP